MLYGMLCIVCLLGAQGVQDSTLPRVTPELKSLVNQCSQIGIFHSDLAEGELCGKNILFNEKGKIVKDENEWGRFVGLEDENEVLAVFEKKGYCFVNTKTWKMLDLSAYDANEYHRFYGNALLAVKKNDKWGAVNKRGELVIPCEYVDIEIRKNIVAATVLKNVVKVFDTTGSPIYPVPFEEVKVSYYNNDTFFAKLKGKWGAVRRDGAVVVPFRINEKYEPTEIKEIKENYVVLYRADADKLNDFRRGLANMRGDVIAPCIYRSLNQIRGSSWLIASKQVNRPPEWPEEEKVGMNIPLPHRYEVEDKPVSPIYRFGILDTMGKQVLPFEYEFVADESVEGTLLLKKDGHYSLMTLADGEIHPLDSEIESVKCQNGMLMVQKNGRYGCLDSTGKEIIPFEYDFMDKFENGFARVAQGKMWGCVDSKGNVKVPIEYGFVSSVSSGIVSVEKDGKWGYVDTAGRPVTPLEYDMALRFDDVNGLAFVLKNGCMGAVNGRGEEVVPCMYASIESCHCGIPGVFLVRQDNKYGLVYKDGSVIHPCIYNRIQYAWNMVQLIFFEKDGQSGYLDLYGGTTWVDAESQQGN